MRILVAQDDEYAETIVSALREESHDAVLVQTVADGSRLAARENFDLAILDLTLGDRADAGSEICQQLRARRPDIPIIFCSARRETADVIAALAAGDDYLIKPFAAAELRARLRALLRRLSVSGSRVEPRRRRIMPTALELHFDGHSASYDGADLGCNRIQFEVLNILASYPGQVLSEEFLLRKLDASGLGEKMQSVAPQVDSLRSKLHKAGGGNEMIRVLRDGYSFTPV